MNIATSLMRNGRWMDETNENPCTSDEAAAFPLRNVTSRAELGQALLHLAWHRSGDRRRLVFGWVESLPPCFPPMRGHPHRDFRVSRRGPWLHVGRFPMSRDSAEAWFEEAAGSHLALPAHPDEPSRGDGALVEAPVFVREPEFGGTSNALWFPFLPKTQGTVIARGLFGEMDGDIAPDVASAASWLTENLFFDLQIHSEFLGGLFMTASQPVVRDVGSVRATRDGSDVELVRIRRWPGTDLAGHRLLAIERRVLGFGMPDEQPVTGPLLEVVASARQDRTAAAVLHPQHGLCWFREPSPWLRTIVSDVRLVGGRRRIIQETDGQGRIVRDYEVDRFGPLGLSSIFGETPDETSPSAREGRAANGRSEAAAAESLGLQWFDDEERAQAAVRRIELLPVWWTRCLARGGDPLELHRAEIADGRVASL